MSDPSEGGRRQLAAERRKARHYAVQALYQWAVSANALGDIGKQFREDFDFRGTDAAYFDELLSGVPAHVSELEASFQPFLNIPLEKLGTVERAVLRIAAYEFAYRLDVPYRVVINEAIALARKFGAADSHKFVNAVLDKLARKVREAEWQQPH